MSGQARHAPSRNLYGHMSLTIFNSNLFLLFQANIICPFYRANDVTSHNETERYIVYNVTKGEFESCRLHNSVDGDVNQTPRIVAVCNNPFSPNYFTLTFRPFSPTPGAFEFHPGKDYFFISTSSVKNLHQRSGGKCRTHNMRLVFRIKDVDLKDNFQSVENVNVAQPRNDDDYSEEDESENEDDVQYVKDSEKAFPVLSKANAATRAVNVSFNILIFILSIYLQKLVYFRPKFD